MIFSRVSENFGNHSNISYKKEKCTKIASPIRQRKVFGNRLSGLVAGVKKWCANLLLARIL